MPTKPPNPKDIQDLAVRPMVMGDIQQHLRIRRRQQKNWDKCNLFDESVRIQKNDHPLVQIAKRIAIDYRAENDASVSARLLSELSRLACSIEKEQAAHVKHLITVCVEAAKMDIRNGRRGGSGDGPDLSRLTYDELVAYIMEEDGVDEVEARELADLAMGLSEVEAGSTDQEDNDEEEDDEDGEAES